MTRRPSQKSSAKSHSRLDFETTIHSCNQLITEKNFEDALELLTSCFMLLEHNHSKHGQFLTLLGLRVAAYVGLRSLDLALKDGKSMLRVDPKDAQCYIQYAKVERARGNPYTALALLQDGLELSCPSDLLHNQLSDEIQETQAYIESQVILSAPRDPIMDFPLEVIGIVLSHIEYRQQIQMLCLSRTWNKALLSLPPLADTLAFPEAISQITPKMLAAALRRWRVPKFLSLAQLTGPSMDAILHELQRWRKFSCLERIEVRDDLLMVWTLPMDKFNLKAISLDHQTMVSLDWICNSLLVRCPGLETARFECVHRAAASLFRSNRLQALELWFTEVNRHLSSYTVVNRDVFSGLPRLERLSCANFSIVERSPLDLRCLQHLKSLSLSECDIPNIYLPSSITSLGLQKCWFRDEADPELPARSFPALTNLTTLNTILDSYPQFLLQAAAKTPPGRLISCDVKEWPYMWGERLLRLLEHDWFRGLQTLHYDAPNLRDAHSQILSAKCPNLRKLFVEDSLSITDKFVRDLVSAPDAKIERILVQGCAEIPSDIIPWARERGVEVEFIR